MQLRPTKSGRQDLNLRPLDPESSALTKLSYAPEKRLYSQQDRRPRSGVKLSCLLTGFMPQRRFVTVPPA